MSSNQKQLGMDALSQGRHDDAVAALQAHLRDVPADYEAETAVAMALFKLGRRDEASDLFAGLMQRQPTSSSVRYHLGLALEEAGKLDAARRAYEAALELRPGFVAVKKRLAGLTPAEEPLDLDDAYQLPPTNREFKSLPEVEPEPARPMAREGDIFESLPELDELAAAKATKPAPAPAVPFDLPPASKAEANGKEPSLELEILPELDEIAIAADETPSHLRRPPRAEPTDDIFGESIPVPPAPADAPLAELPIGEIIDEEPAEIQSIAALAEEDAPFAVLAEEDDEQIPVAAIIAGPDEEVAMAIPVGDDAPWSGHDDPYPETYTLKAGQSVGIFRVARCQDGLLELQQSAADNFPKRAVFDAAAGTVRLEGRARSGREDVPADEIESIRVLADQTGYSLILALKSRLGKPISLCAETIGKKSCVKLLHAAVHLHRLFGWPIGFGGKFADEALSLDLRLALRNMKNVGA